jgi:1-acyl-sn-glycerol-3-phosphate acyltransferase
MPGRERLRAATEQLRGHLADHVAQVSVTTGIALPDEAPLSMRDNG